MKWKIDDNEPIVRLQNTNNVFMAKIVGIKHIHKYRWVLKIHISGKNVFKTPLFDENGNHLEITIENAIEQAEVLVKWYIKELKMGINKVK